MQAEYRSRSRCNVMTLTRARAMLPGNQIGICSPRATVSSPVMKLGYLQRRWRAVEGDVYERMEAGGLPVDEPASDLQARQFHTIFAGSNSVALSWRRDFNFGLMPRLRTDKT